MSSAGEIIGNQEMHTGWFLPTLETITLFTHSRHWQALCDNSLMKKNIISQH